MDGDAALQGHASVRVPDDVARAVAGQVRLDVALRVPLAQVQLDELGAAGVRHTLTYDTVEVPWGVYARWTAEPGDDGWHLVVARPGVRSTLGWDPACETAGPSDAARVALDAALARVHPLLAGLALTVG